MRIGFLFIINSLLFGVGLAMDAFSVSLANGMNEPEMKPSRMVLIAGTFAFFQIAMPLIGWFLVKIMAEAFSAMQKFIPYIAFVLLLFIGGKMILESIKSKGETAEKASLGFGALLVQGIATSIDALSVGFTIVEYSFKAALLESLIIGVVTFAICLGGLLLGKKFGTKLSSKSGVLGGCILIAIGLEILIKGII